MIPVFSRKNNFILILYNEWKISIEDETGDQRTIGPENAHLKPDPAVLSHHEMTLTLTTHTPLLNS